MDDKTKQELQAIFEGLNLDNASVDKVIQLFNENVDKKVSVEVDVALQEQDSIFAEQLQNFITKLDTKHAEQVSQLVEAIDIKYTSKLKQLTEAYNTKYKGEFDKFRKDLLQTNKLFLDMYIDKAMPTKMISESIKLKKQENLINNLKSILAVDSASQKAIVMEGIIDAKKTINENANTIDSLRKEQKNLHNQLLTQKRDILLEQKLNSVPAHKRESLYKIYKDQSIEQIHENFEYSSKIIDRERRSIRKDIADTIISEKSKNGEFVKAMPTQQILNESTQQSIATNKSLMAEYVAELSK